MSFVSNLITNVADKFKSKYGTDEAVERTTKAVKSSLKNIAIETVKKVEQVQQTISHTCEYDNCDIKLRKKNTFNGKVYCNKHFKTVKSAFAKDAKVRCVHVFGQNSGTPGERCKAQAIDGRYCNRHKPKRNENKQQDQSVKKEKPQIREYEEESSFDFNANPVDINNPQNIRFWKMVSVDVKLNGYIETLGYHKITGILLEESSDNDGYTYTLRGIKNGNVITDRNNLPIEIITWCESSNIIV